MVNIFKQYSLNAVPERMPKSLKPEVYFDKFMINFNPFEAPDTSYSVLIYVCVLKTFVHTDWLFSALENISEQQWIR